MQNKQSTEIKSFEMIFYSLGQKKAFEMGKLLSISHQFNKIFRGLVFLTSEKFEFFELV